MNLRMFFVSVVVFVAVIEENAAMGGRYFDCSAIISRSQWGARRPRRTNTLSTPVSTVYIHHSATPSCNSQYSCSRTIRGFQNYHMNNRGWYDIGYNFLVGEDGNMYEGRGWETVGSHTYGHNSNSLGICVIGDYTNVTPNSAAISALRHLLFCGVLHGHLSSSFTLRGHRDVSDTFCPGGYLYHLIRRWSHYN